jgi:5-methylcytosine-specific restriction endonuclease McrA
MKKIKNKLKESVKEIQHSIKAETVNKYNSIVLGEQQYYSIACNVSKDFGRIGWEVDRVLYNRLRSKSKAGKRKKKQKKREVTQVSKTYKKFYGDYNFRKRSIAGIVLFPIGGVKQSNPMNFSQEICNYTAKGRKLIHDNLNGYSISVLRYLMYNPVKGMTVEYNDNRQSLYTGQNGLCGVMGTVLDTKSIHCHHIVPKGKGYYGSDKYDNLTLIHSDAHTLIHAVDQKIIAKYLTLLTPDKQQLAKINKLRTRVGNTIIS